MSLYDYDVIIIGGGISGLVTAYKLAQTDQSNILLIESTNRLGGRLYTLHKKEGVQLEMGAGRISSKHEKMMTLLKELYEKSDNELYEDVLIKLPSDIKYKLSMMKDINFYSIIKQLQKESKQLSKQTKQKVNLLQVCIDSLGFDASMILKTKLGYDSEFELMNGYHALESFKDDLFSECEYYILKHGFSDIVDRLHKFLTSKNVVIKLDTEVVDIANHRVKVHRNEYTAEHIVCCIPQKELMKFKLYQENELFAHVTPVPLLRIYAKYPLDKDNKVWFHNIKRTITDNYIRHVIPIDYEKGIIMISYIDGQYAKMWRNITKLGNKELTKRLHKEIKELFNIDPPDPEYLEHYYWSEGCHMWKPGVDVEEVYTKLLQPNPKQKIYIVNEAFSKHQCWVEGCLNMSYNVLQLIDPNFTSTKSEIKGGKKKPKKKPKQSKKYKIKEVLSHSNWIVLDIKGKKRIYNVGKWFKKHPGGRDNLKKGSKANKYYLDSKKYPEAPIDLFKQIGAHSSGKVIQMILNDKLPDVELVGFLDD